MRLLVTAVGFCVGVGLLWGDPRVLQLDAFAALERENAIWRSLRTEKSLQENVELLAKMGVMPDELAQLYPALKEVWEVDPNRNFGWISPESTERIREIDRKYAALVRAARLHENFGVLQNGKRPLPIGTLDHRWHKEVVGALEYHELGEFLRMNSPAGRQAVADWRGIPLTAAEQRLVTECYLEIAGPNRSEGRFRVTSATRQNRRFGGPALNRALLAVVGPERFTAFLGNVEPQFADYEAAVLPLTGGDRAKMIDLWFVTKEAQQHRSRQNASRGYFEKYQTQVRALIGDENFQRLQESGQAQWLF